MKAPVRRGQRIGFVHGRRRLPRQAQPEPQAARYLRLLAPLMAMMRRTVEDALHHAAVVEGLIADADVPGPRSMGEIAARALREATQRIRERWTLRGLQTLVAPIAVDVDRVSRANVQRALSIPLSEVPGVRPESLQQWTQQNAKLVSTVSERYLTEVGAQVEESYAAGERWEELAKRLQERFGVAESNSERIARTETAKLSQTLTRERFGAAGIDRGIWRTTRDERVRDSHSELEGEEFVLTQGLGGIWPGSEPNCRCWSDPVLDD